MDECFTVQDQLRPDVADSLASLPLVTIAWRAMRAECSRRRQDDDTLQTGLLGIADELLRLRATAAKTAETSSVEQSSRSVDILGDIADSLQVVLARLGMVIVAPKGESYTPEYMQLIDNIAQVPRLGITCPQVDEVVEPAILYRGGLCRMGKAVIALPMDKGILGDGR